MVVEEVEEQDILADKDLMVVPTDKTGLVEVEVVTMVADPTLVVKVVTLDKMDRTHLAVVVMVVEQELLLMVGLIDTYSQVITTETSVEQKTTRNDYVTQRYWPTI